MDDFWNELYKDVPIILQPGEKTISMMMEEVDRPIRHQAMRQQAAHWVEEGKLIYVGKRIANGRLADAYKPNP